MKYFIFLAVFISAYFVYWQTWPPTLFWQDAGIFLTAIKTLGIAYPPGFPLYVMLGHLITKVIPWENFAQKVHAFSALWGAAAAGLMALCAWEIFSSEEWGAKLKKGIKILLSLVIGLTTALTYSLWSQSINAEVYSLHAFFTAGFLYLIVLWGKKTTWQFSLKGAPKRVLLLLAVDVGLSFANHPLAITFLVPVAFLVYINRDELVYQYKSSLLLLLIFLICGGLPYLYLPLRARMDPPLNWGDPSTLGRFLQHITGRGYLAPFELSYFTKLKEFLILFWEEFFALPIIFGFFGLCWFYKKKQLFFIVVILLAGSVLALAYFYFTGEDFWLIPFYLVFILFFIYGLGYSFSIWGKKTLKIYLAGVVVAVGSLLPLLVVNWKFLDRSDYYLPLDFGKNILRPLERDSIFFIFGDQPSSTVLYLQEVEGYRTDVAVINFAVDKLGFFHDRERLARKYPHLEFPEVNKEDSQETIISRLVDFNLDQHPVYFVGLRNVPRDFKHSLIASGAFWKVSQEEKEMVDLKYWDFQFTDPDFYQRAMKKETKKETLLASGKESWMRITYHDELIDFLAQAFKNLGDWYFARQEFVQVVEAYERIFTYRSDFHNQEYFFNLDLARSKIEK